MREKSNIFFHASVIGKKKKFYEEIVSTQIEAKKLTQSSIENGTMILADCQTNGIGTHNRKWYSEKGKNISLTLILYPKCKVKELESLTVDIAKCIVNSIYDLYGYKLDIKLPNDIMYSGKKIGGILTQIVSKGENIKYLLIGIGLNVNGEKFPEDLKEIATSLKLEFRQEFSRQKIVELFCINFERYCEEKGIINIQA